MDEYRSLFNLTASDLNKSILGVGDGPASFNAEMAQLGKRVISIDPLYAFNANEIETQFYKVVESIISQVKQSPNDWVWSYHDSPDHLRENRIKALHTFLNDYAAGQRDGRYLIGELPKLDTVLNDKMPPFDLALCSHLLFLYSKQFNYEFHKSAVYNILSKAHEIRIFPLLTLDLKRSPHLEPLICALKSDGFKVRIEKVAYEIQLGGNEMLCVAHP